MQQVDTGHKQVAWFVALASDFDGCFHLARKTQHRHRMHAQGFLAYGREIGQLHRIGANPGSFQLGAQALQGVGGAVQPIQR